MCHCRKKQTDEMKNNFLQDRFENRLDAGKPKPPKLTLVKVIPQRISYFDTTGERPVKYMWEAAA